MTPRVPPRKCLKTDEDCELLFREDVALRAGDNLVKAVNSTIRRLNFNHSINCTCPICKFCYSLHASLREYKNVRQDIDDFVDICPYCNGLGVNSMFKARGSLSPVCSKCAGSGRLPTKKKKPKLKGI